jgi:hypothetical protein
MREKRSAYRILVEKPEGKRPTRKPRCSERIILKWFIEKWVGVVLSGLIWLKIGPSVGLF